MASGNRWTRDQLLVVLNLYHKLRFGQLDARQPVIIDLAQRLGRTPGSATSTVKRGKSSTKIPPTSSR